ncbi:hypothetical protein [Microlunatus parietis]|uniref:Uncharacterized protein n=1 Tax=Microlunatus parietis TaxID=682979 RepID=A0A7Y9IE38_9ACTN|nr:hypothetical protein [Microlunatus parietis]NYE75258.1 hypothetical protein [Microlunatus parietis]
MTSANSSQRDLEARSRLFEPGERLGWQFRDRFGFAQPFTEPEPEQTPLPYWIQNVSQTAASRFRSRRNLAAIMFWVGTLISLALALYNALFVPGGDFFRFFVGGVVVSIVLALGTVIFGWTGRGRLVKTAAKISEDAAEEDVRRRADWLDRQLDWQIGERERVGKLPEWGAVTTPPETRRLDIFGGNIWSWQAFLTVYGTSALARHPVVLLDLSREVVSEELVRAAEAARVPIDAQLLPKDLATTTLLADLTPGQLIDALIESMYGDDEATARAERTMDRRLLTALADELGDSVTLARLASGLRALMDHPDDDGVLSARERNRIADDVFPADYRRQSAERLQRLESYLQPLERLGTEAQPRDLGYLTCMALASEGNNAAADFLTDLLVQWLTQRITANPYLSEPEVIVVGADAIKLRHLERLSDACERRGIRITLMFRNLRGEAENFIGRGIAGFMRLGNAAEAGRAADHIGREHKFVISQITASVGSNETRTTGDSWGHSETMGVNVGTSVGWNRNWGSNANRKAGLLAPDESYSSSKGYSKSENTNEGRNWSSSRNWSATRSFAEGTNWSEAKTNQRVQEYVVEPNVLQNLPEHAMLLVEPQRGQHQPNLVPVEFDPAIVTLPGVSMEPLPEVAEPAEHPLDGAVRDQRALTAERTGGFTLDDFEADDLLAEPEPVREERGRTGDVQR